MSVFLVARYELGRWGRGSWYDVYIRHDEARQNGTKVTIYIAIQSTYRVATSLA
jgi:hypothetical protein